MVKKKSFIFFVILLLTLYVGLFSSCYAFTEKEYKSLIYNTLVYKDNVSDTSAKSLIDNYNFSYLSNYIENSNFKLFLTGNSLPHYLWIVKNVGTGNNSPYIYNGTLYGNYTSVYLLQIYSTSLNGFTSTGNPSNINGNFIYTDFRIDNNSHSQILYQAGYANPSYLLYENDYNRNAIFEIQEVTTTTHVKISNDGVSMPLYYAPRF